MIMIHLHCIFRIPNNLSSHNENAYVPEAFSIGPYHYAKQPHKSITLRDIANTIQSIEEEARACYAEPVDMCLDEFVKVLVLDGCFIVELFRKNAYEDLRGVNDNDPVFSTSCVLQFLYHDLILLENQIPWLVLDRLFDMTNQAYSESAEELTGFVFGEGERQELGVAETASGHRFRRDGDEIQEGQRRSLHIGYGAQRRRSRNPVAVLPGHDHGMPVPKPHRIIAVSPQLCLCDHLLRYSNGRPN
ncbi:hypothetical protein TIFTF001_043364 [Ficus carica]|uniref:Uncharacterized protein n=1 Tax=Ficus carica TaxID=3494 RepID=A0AA87YSF4_FICCA|nr:hypothetical protein TIFTF001_043364 [Ficus carica]